MSKFSERETRPEKDIEASRASISLNLTLKTPSKVSKSPAKWENLESQFPEIVNEKPIQMKLHKFPTPKTKMDSSKNR
ncbi:hypothetical protein B9Z55_027962 [Caenorhabditis nigoni]|uniref:Uncharacterized protein n=1 Tax=Caenorhabditis nigoni TaxID=1611254 RepID=A0A2G5SDY8_9PELO|nr:hypothetical protein B9Z55_027962 [Caenorhabditis nigoni]